MFTQPDRILFRNPQTQPEWTQQLGSVFARANEANITRYTILVPCMDLTLSSFEDSKWVREWARGTQLQIILQHSNKTRIVRDWIEAKRVKE
jgi:hypothetical protein